MAIPKFLEDLNIVSRIGNKPGSDSGLTTEQFKAKFDEGLLKFQTYINEHLIPGIENAVSEEGLLAQINSILNKKLDKSGGTITGELNMTGALNVVAPTEAANAVPKSYVDTKKHPFTLQFSAWTDAAPYTQNITVKGLTDEVFARVYPVYPTALEEKLALTEEASKVRNCTRHGDVMTFECWEDKPVKDIPIVVEVYV